MVVKGKIVCPNCRLILKRAKFMRSSFLPIKVGSPKIKCPKCKTEVPTGHSPLSTMTYHVKEGVYVYLGLKIIIMSFLVAIPAGALVGWGLSNYIDYPKYAIMVLSCIPFFIGMATIHLVKYRAWFDKAENNHKFIGSAVPSKQFRHPDWK